MWFGFWFVNKISVVNVEGFVIIGMVNGIKKGFFFIVSLFWWLVEGNIIFSVIRKRIILFVMLIVFCFMLRKFNIDWLLNRKINKMISVNISFFINIICFCWGFIDFSIDMKIGRLFRGFMIKNNMIVVD